MAATPIPANWPEIRAMFAAGAEYQDLERATGVKSGTIRSRAVREGWTRKASGARLAEVKADRQQQAVDQGKIAPHALATPLQHIATRPSDTLLEQLGKESRILAAKATRNALHHASTLSGEEALAASRPVKDAVGAAAIVHRWEQDRAGIEVNIYANQERYADAIEIESEVQDVEPTE
jgi:hypothetical protein